MNDRIVEYYRKHRILIEENLQLSRDPKDVEAIHNMRLSIKRMRVVADLADRISEGKFKSKQQLTDINKLFKSAGRLRDIQVGIQLLAEFDKEKLVKVIDSFETKELKQRRKYDDVLGEFDPGVLAGFEDELIRHTGNADEKLIMFAGLSMLSELELSIHQTYHASGDEKRLHRIRRKLKDINYLNNIYDEALPVAEQLNIDLEKLRNLGEIAGSWHDALVLESILGKHIAKYPDESNAIVEVLSEVNSRKKELYQEYTCTLINEMKI
jgi:CHAD domain-containing protein